MKKVKKRVMKRRIAKPFLFFIVIIIALVALSSLWLFSDYGFAGKAIKNYAVSRVAQPGVHALTECSDGMDNDGDGLLDYPIDSGCASAVDNSEIDTFIRDNITAFATWNTEDMTKYVPSEPQYDTGYPANWDPSAYKNLKNIVLMVPLPTHAGGPPFLKEEELTHSSLPQKIKAWTDQQPEGRRAIEIWMIDTWRLSAHPDDVVLDQNSNVQGFFIDKNGKFQPYAGIFWDNAVKDISKDITTFFTEYKKIGGKVDWVMQDYEANFQNIGWLRKPANDYFNLANLEKMGWEKPMDARTAYFTALQQDPRFQAEHQPAIDQMHNEQDNQCVWLEHMLELSDACEKHYSAYIKPKVHNYLNEAFYKPIAKIFPKVKNSNFESMYFDPTYCFPSISGQIIDSPYCFSGEDGSHTGTHQSPYIYGRLGYDIGKVKLDGKNNYSLTPFNAFRYDVNKFRLSVLSSDVPNTPFVAFKSFSYIQDPPSTFVALFDTYYYEELILHVLLSGADDLLYYNGPKKDDIVLDKVIEEFNVLAGFADRVWLKDSLVGWGDDYVLTGMQTGGRKVYRFTPNDAVSFKVIENKKGVTFISGKTEIFISGGKIYEPKNKVSSVGYWIVQPLPTPLPASNLPTPNLPSLT